MTCIVFYVNMIQFKNKNEIRLDIEINFLEAELDLLLVRLKPPIPCVLPSTT